MCRTERIPSSPNVYSAAPTIVTRVPGLTSPKNGPAAVPANVQNTAARGGSMRADSHVRGKFGNAPYQ